MKKVKFVTESGSPNTEEWHAWRKAGIGASDAISIAAKAGIIKNPPSWANGNKLLAQKLGVSTPTTLNPYMERGQELESEARRRFEEETGIIVMPTFGEMDDRPYMRASYDGVSFFKAIVEIKCPSDVVHNMAKNGQVVEYYLPQLAHQCMVMHGEPHYWTGEETLFFVSYNPEDAEKDIAIVRMKSAQLRYTAELLIGVEHNFHQKRTYLEKRNYPQLLAQFERHYEGLLETYAEADATSKSAREYLGGLVEQGYVPQNFSVKTGTRNAKQLDKEAVLKTLGWEDVPSQYRGDSIMVVSLKKPTITFSNGLEAELAKINSDQIIKSLEPEMEKFKQEAI
ncbi:MAG: YqaJ viral recombinase family protein, partial [Gammaproteobacteria bacterium]|nr:YqaJ viral recombinase family protein [Gammaproteobacteria bacterium]